MTKRTDVLIKIVMTTFNINTTLVGFTTINVIVSSIRITLKTKTAIINGKTNVMATEVPPCMDEGSNLIYQYQFIFLPSIKVANSKT